MCNRIFHNVTREDAATCCGETNISAFITSRCSGPSLPFQYHNTKSLSNSFCTYKNPRLLFLCNTLSLTYLFSYIYKLWENLSVGREKSQSKRAPSSLQQRREGGNLGPPDGGCWTLLCPFWGSWLPQKGHRWPPKGQGTPTSSPRWPQSSLRPSALPGPLACTHKKAVNECPEKQLNPGTLTALCWSHSFFLMSSLLYFNYLKSNIHLD